MSNALTCDIKPSTYYLILSSIKRCILISILIKRSVLPLPESRPECHGTQTSFESSLEEPPTKNRKLCKDDGQVEERSEPAKKSACKQRMLKKTEKDTIIAKLKSLDPQEIASASLTATRKQLPKLNDGLQELCSAVNSCELCFFIEHLRDTLVALY